MRWVEDVFWGSVRRFVALEGFDRAMALAGQMFAALLPLLIVVSTVSPAGGDDAADTLVDKLELKGSSADTIEAAVAQPAEIGDSISFLSLFILIVSALSFTRAMQRLYANAWGLPKLGLRGTQWGLVWLFAFCVFWSLQPLVISLFGGALETVVALSLSTAMWTVTPWLLVAKQIDWRRLLPQGLLTAISVDIFAVVSALYMPEAVSSSAEQFGFIGVGFAILSWLFIIGMILVVTAAVGASVVERPSAPETA